MKKQQLGWMLSLLATLLLTQGAFAQDDKEFHMDEVYEIASNGAFHLRASDADIQIIGSERSDVRVKVDRVEVVRGLSSRSRDFDMEVENKGGDLYVTERRGQGTHINIGYHRLDYKILIELPKAASLRIRGDDDDYYIKNVNGGISMRADDGDIELVDCGGESFEIELEDGNLRMNEGAGKIYLEMDDGDADIINAAFERVEINLEDGSLNLETALSDNGTYELRADDADIDLVVLKGGGEFMIRKDDGRVRYTREYELIEETDYRTELKLPGGTASVRIRTDDGRVSLEKQ